MVTLFVITIPMTSFQSLWDGTAIIFHFFLWQWSINHKAFENFLHTTLPVSRTSFVHPLSKFDIQVIIPERSRWPLSFSPTGFGASWSSFSAASITAKVFGLCGSQGDVLGIDSLEKIWNCINLQFRSSHVPIFMFGDTSILTDAYVCSVIWILTMSS